MESKQTQLYNTGNEIKNISVELHEKVGFDKYQPQNQTFSRNELTKVEIFEAQLILIKLQANVEVFAKILEFEIERKNALGL